MVKKIFLSIFNLIFLAALSSCSSYGNDDDDLRTIPVTNNPLIVPDSGSALPGIPMNGTPR